MSVWPSRTIQAVWFGSNAAGLEAPAVYRAFFQEEPDTTQRNRNVSAAAPYTSIAQGQIKGVSALVQLTPGRLDVVMRPIEPEGPDEIMPLLDTERTFQIVLDAFKTADFDYGDVGRISLVANLDVASDGIVAANTFFQEYVGVAVPVDHVADLVFQVNSRLSNEMPDGFVLNRIVRASVVLTRQLLVRVMPDDGGPSQIPIGTDTYSTSILCDFNNVPDGRIMDTAVQSMTLDAISKHIMSVATKSRLKDLWS